MEDMEEYKMGNDKGAFVNLSQTVIPSVAFMFCWKCRNCDQQYTDANGSSDDRSKTSLPGNI